MREARDTRQAGAMASPTPARPTAGTTARTRPPLDDDVARALIRAQVRRRHRRSQRVLTRV
jgi:hypothetical protein